MTNRKKLAGILCFFCILISEKIAASTSITSDTSVGSSTVVTGITYDGDTYSDKVESKGDKKQIWNWNGGYTYSQNATTDATTGASIVDQTHEVTAGFGWTGPSHLEAGLGLAYATTPAEHLIDAGPNMNVGYTFHFGGAASNKKVRVSNSTAQLRDAELGEFGGAAAESESARKSQSDEGFDPTLSLKETVTILGYTQTFTFDTIPRKNLPSRPVTGSNLIRQTGSATEVAWSPWKFFKVKYTFTSYRYDKNVITFLQNLDSPRAVRTGASGFSSALGGFPLEMHELSFSFYFLDDWEFEPYASGTTNIVDGTKLYVAKGTLSRDISNWNVGLGYERDNSPVVIDSIILVTVRLNL